MVTYECFRACSDPIRRRILEILADSPTTVSALVANFEVSRPAISRHLRVLRQSGVVEEFPRGRERIYRLRPDALEEAADWLRSVGRDAVLELPPVEKPEEAPQITEKDWREW